MAQALMKFETIDSDQVADIMDGREPREPKGWNDSGSGSSGSSARPAEAEPRADKPLGGPAGEH
ncbi:ATP-dependent zinc metalloprotease FtsH [compost metagenome]